MSAKVFGIDFGTNTIKIYRKNEGVIFDEKNIIALCKGEVMAIGDEAFEMLGKSPDNFLVTYPVKNGVIADIANMLALLNKAFKTNLDAKIYEELRKRNILPYTFSFADTTTPFPREPFLFFFLSKQSYSSNNSVFCLIMQKNTEIWNIPNFYRIE